MNSAAPASPAASADNAAPQPSPVELEVRRIRRIIRERRHGDALRAAEALAIEVPENRDVLLLIASCQRQCNRIEQALETLQRLESLHPRFSRLYQERGYCRVVLKDSAGAIDAFLRAVNLNPALPASWDMLQGLYRMVGDTVNAATAAQHVETLKRLPPEVIRATSLYSEGDLGAAEHLVRGYLLQHGNHVEAMRLLAKIGVARDVLDDAELLLDAVLTLAPDYRAARHDYARVLIERHKYQQARSQLDQLLLLDPDNRDYRTLYATACVGLGEHARAVPLYQQLLVGAQHTEELHLSIAHALKALGQRAAAVDAYRAAAAARPGYGDAYWSLANLKTYRFLDQEIACMEAEERAPATSPVDRFHLCFALGKAYEDRGEFERSWTYYQRGNALKRAESRYRPEILENNTRMQIATCTPEFFAARRGWGAPQRDPILIVGLPRSGSTLLEQILASHSQVEGTQELSDIQRMVIELQGRAPDIDNPRYPAVLADIGPEDALRMGEKYLRDTRVYRSDRPYFIDKMPNNFRHLGLIHLILPNARIIDARRDPMACCFSNLKQLFANGQEFTYSVDDIARYYRTYLELMRHWDQVLPGKVLRVWHEDVVEDLEGNVRRLLDFCGLEFEPACIEFHRTERSVRTASSEQVRQPIFREGIDQWKHYERWLGALRDALGDATLRYR
jgi:tetratricopeptide (TPR) repeat protein